MNDKFNILFIKGTPYNGDDHSDIISIIDTNKVPEKGWIVRLKPFSDETVLLFKVTDILQYPVKKKFKVFGDIIRVVEPK